MRELGLYIHIPFCIKKCNYCDFYSLCHSSVKEQEYISALCKHIKRDAHKYKDCEFNTVFIGGGTPSVLSVDGFNTLAKTVNNHLNLTQGGEFTLEANPGTLTREKLLSYRRAGVNRLSIGLQSTNGEELSTLGRIHTVDEFSRGYLLARECGFDNISIDVMYGLPNQKIGDFTKTLDQVCDFNPEHISAYCLKIEENTPFYKQRERLSLPSEDEQYEMYLLLCNTLGKRGYSQYEISNFAKKGYRSKHNMKYWQSKEYVGFGPSAHSFFDGVRYFYPRDINSYIVDPVAEIEDESRENSAKIDQMDEYVMLKLRLKDGISEGEFFGRFGSELLAEYPSINKYLKSGHMELRNGSYSFTPSGFFVSNYILTDILHF
ncbi:MAG: radical SAM family heme chaperone HemW [Clostridia bacterium]|nr:radical SAM family heme chaperone HemW [Clostridia bacterium]